MLETFNRIQSVRVLVIGDFLLDVYTKGNVDRISPEAPVPVLLVSEITQLPGGAGNVAFNLQALGARVGVIGRIGKDDAGERLKRLLGEEGIETEGLLIEEGFRTSLKNRFLAGGQQLMRTDYEVVSPLTESLEKKAIAYVCEVLSQYDIVAVSDYGKGFLTLRLLKCILEEGKKKGIRIIVDPKGLDFTKYSGAYLIKPNNKEAYIASGLEPQASIQEVVREIFKRVDTEHVLVTRSDKGMILFSKTGGEQNFPVVKKEVIDVTGAGDTVLAMIAFSLANKLSFSHTIVLANIAASLAVERVGCAAIRLSEVAERLLEKESKYKIFWEETELFVLERILELSSFTILDLKDQKEMSSQIYYQIKEAAGKKDQTKLIVHIRPTKQNKNFIHLLASMHEIDFVFARNDDPMQALQASAILTTI